jgi:exopolysaccharide biosynthesis polyprenyl glycosylphosphotransferase
MDPRGVDVRTGAKPLVAPSVTEAAQGQAAGIDRPLRSHPPRERVRHDVQRQGTNGARLVLVDSTAFGAAAVATLLTAPTLEMRAMAVATLVGFTGIALILFAYLGLYRPRFVLSILDEARLVLAGTTIAALAITFAIVAVTDRASVATEVAYLWALATAGVCAGRVAVDVTERRRRRTGTAGSRTMVLGAGKVGKLVATRLRQHPESGLHPVAFLDPSPLADGIDLPVIGRNLDVDDALGFADALEAGVSEFEVDHVLVTFSRLTHETELAIMRRCQELGIGVSIVPRLFEGTPDRTYLGRVGGLPLNSVYPTDPRGWQFAFKYGADRLFAAVALVLVSPLLLVAALGTLITLGRPVFFRQRRVGMDGREFELLKLRSMRGEQDGNADRFNPGQVNGSALAPGGVEGEDRRSRFGTMLRRTSIDELPQLINVLRGEMSLVGPRPERPGYSSAFSDAVHRYADRNRVKSGITGWAQVHGLRGRTSIADRAEWDNYYIENWSIWLDLKIVLLTVVAVIRDPVE